MGDEKPRTWVDPDGRFSLDLPIAWKAMSPKGAPIVDFVKNVPHHGIAAKVSVEMRSIPPGVRLTHFDLAIEREMKKSARNYRLLAQEKLQVGESTARRRHFTYQEFGNAQLTNEAVQIVLVTDSTAWIITLLTAAGARDHFQADFDKMLKRFNPSGEVRSVVGAKKRKKLRSGEMVNPDLIKY